MIRKLLGYLNPVSWVAKIAGPKVLIGVAATALAAIGAMWWALSGAWEAKAEAQQRVGVYKQAAEQNAEQWREERRQRRRTQEILAEREREKAALRKEVAAAMNRLEKAKGQVDEAEQDCLDMPVGGPIDSELRQWPGGSGNGNGN